MEWTFETIREHEAQMDYMFTLGYRKYAPQFIVNHLEEPDDWYDLQESNANELMIWHQIWSDWWIDGGWKKANLRPTADVGMLWFS